MSALASHVLRRLRGDPVEPSPQRAAAARRTVLLLGAIVLMGLGDLFCTVTYMKLIGLPEANPIARWMAQFGSTQGLVLYKLLTIAMSCGALYLARFYRHAEVCAWVCAGILFALSIHWINFNRNVSEHTNWITFIAADQRHALIANAGSASRTPEGWVTLSD